MPLKVNITFSDPLYRDYDFTITDKDMLAEYISQLVLGHAFHIERVIKKLDPNFPNINRASVQAQINILKKDIDNPESEYTYKIDGWLFQMMSWLALNIQHKGEKFYIQYPHSQPSMHGLDGIAITLNDDNTIDRIIITEDKCTSNPRKKIKDDVFPEFDNFEKAMKDNAIQQQIQSIIRSEEYIMIQNDIQRKEHRQYRIGITRKECHNNKTGRDELFKDYDKYVDGDDVERRTGATIFLPNLREWMLDLRKKVIVILEKKIV